jgi:hypothetical protein
MIVEDVIAAAREGRSPIVLTERTEHLEYFAEKLGRVVLHAIVLRGGMTERERRGVMERLEAIPDGEERVLLATGRYIGEGFDDGRLDTLFLAMPVSWKGTLVQYAGRLHRLHPGKREVRIVDYVDGQVPVLIGSTPWQSLLEGSTGGVASAGSQLTMPCPFQEIPEPLDDGHFLAHLRDREEPSGVHVLCEFGEDRCSVIDGAGPLPVAHQVIGRHLGCRDRDGPARGLQLRRDGEIHPASEEEPYSNAPDGQRTKHYPGDHLELLRLLMSSAVHRCRGEKAREPL